MMVSAPDGSNVDVKVEVDVVVYIVYRQRLYVQYYFALWWIVAIILAFSRLMYKCKWIKNVAAVSLESKLDGSIHEASASVCTCGWGVAQRLVLQQRVYKPFVLFLMLLLLLSVHVARFYLYLYSEMDSSSAPVTVRFPCTRRNRRRKWRHMQIDKHLKHSLTHTHTLTSRGTHNKII